MQNTRTEALNDLTAVDSASFDSYPRQFQTFPTNYSNLSPEILHFPSFFLSLSSEQITPYFQLLVLPRESVFLSSSQNSPLRSILHAKSYDTLLAPMHRRSYTAKQYSRLEGLHGLKIPQNKGDTSARKSLEAVVDQSRSRDFSVRRRSGNHRETINLVAAIFSHWRSPTNWWPQQRHRGKGGWPRVEGQSLNTGARGEGFGKGSTFYPCPI